MRSLIVAVTLVAAAAHGQPSVSPGHGQGDVFDGLTVAVMDGTGVPMTSAALVAAMAETDVIYLGEIHDDSLGHVAELRLFGAALRVAREQGRSVVLALEMFEADVQTVLDEYRAGTIEERDFLAASRPWGNYARDYRPLVEAARAHGVHVVASNAPARYVRLVSREGLTALDGLSAAARALLPPLPIAPPSAAMAAAFTDLMSEMAGHGGGPSVEGMLVGQNLRDATMGYRVARALGAPDRPLVVHINGSFHSQGGLGIPEHVARRVPGVRQLVVTLAPTRPEPGTGDVLIWTVPDDAP